MRLFAAEELLDIGVTPAVLMKAQGFDRVSLALLKFNPDQPRVPAGSGSESGRWTPDGAITPASHRTRARMKALGAFIEWLKSRLKGSAHETPQEKAPPVREATKPASKPSGSLESDLPQPGYGEEVSIPGMPDTIKGIDTTDRGAGMANYKADMTQSEFETILSNSGWTKEPGTDGKAMIYTKDGAKYSVRDDAKSTGGPTADFFYSSGNGKKIDMKLRLRND